MEMLLEDSAQQQPHACTNAFNDLVGVSQNTESYGLSQVIDQVGEQHLGSPDSNQSEDEFDNFNGSFRDQDFVHASIDQTTSQEA